MEMFGFRKRKQERLRRQPPPANWRPILARNMPYFELLSEAEQQALLGEMQFFLEDKEFEGCDDFEITEEVRVTIAAQACLLLINRENDGYSSLRSILVYPRAFRVHSRHELPDGTVIEGDETRLGESWYRGSLVLSWDSVLGGAADIRDGHNVVLHEFAHQLDAESGAVEGAPGLSGRGAYARWARVMRAEYAELLAAVEGQHRTVMDHYGATSPAEFFAVATEAFFEKPLTLKKRHPELYTTLADFYQQDPASRLPANRRLED